MLVLDRMPTLGRVAGSILVRSPRPGEFVAKSPPDEIVEGIRRKPSGNV